METRHRFSRLAGWIFTTALVLSPMALAEEPEEHQCEPGQKTAAYEPKFGWAFAIDNDIFVPGTGDSDYTFGAAVRFTGLKSDSDWLWLKTPISFLNQVVSIPLSSSGLETYSIDTGFFGFTPADKQPSTPIQNDRPYASLIYYSNTYERVEPDQGTAWQTQLTVGVLGLPTVGQIQNGVHDLINNTKAKGWDNQISDGGELTARYSVAYQKELPIAFDNVDLKSTFQASAGYLTQASWSLGMRAGKLNSPWWSFKPEITNYGEKSVDADVTVNHSESYFWAGISLKARAYNAFLQGQFRHSEVKYDFTEIRPFIAEAWLGYTFAFEDGFRLSYVARAQTSELRVGRGDRELFWGGIVIAKVFN